MVFAIENKDFPEISPNVWEQHERQIQPFVVGFPAVVPWYYAIYISEDPKSALRGFEISSKLPPA